MKEKKSSHADFPICLPYIWWQISFILLSVKNVTILSKSLAEARILLFFGCGFKFLSSLYLTYGICNQKN